VQNTSNAQDQEVSEVNVVPLADVTLVLLIVLMVISPMVLQSMIQVQAAQAVSTKAQTAVREKPLFVDVTTEGFRLNNEIIPTEYELFRTLQKDLSMRTDKTVLVSAESTVVYQNVVRVLDLVRQSGAVSLSLVPRKDAPPQPARPS
jgi:biopolymer transport protein ExbD